MRIRTQLILIAASLAIFLTGCNSTKTRAKKAGAAIGNVKATKKLPEYPPDCRKKAKHGIRKGDRYDIALKRAAAALDRQNGRTDRCAKWYDGVRSGFAKESENER